MSRLATRREVVRVGRVPAVAVVPAVVGLLPSIDKGVPVPLPRATRREVVREVEGELCAAPEGFASRWLAGDVSLAGKSVGEVIAALGGRRGVYPMRGLWTTVPYTSLRNAAWLVRAARHGKDNNPVALAVVIAEVVRLVGAGEQLGDVIEALCELLVHP